MKVPGQTESVLQPPPQTESQPHQTSGNRESVGDSNEHDYSGGADDDAVGDIDQTEEEEYSPNEQLPITDEDTKSHSVGESPSNQNSSNI
jgi:hypothetical protein